MNRKVQKR